MPKFVIVRIVDGDWVVPQDDEGRAVTIDNVIDALTELGKVRGETDAFLAVIVE